MLKKIAVFMTILLISVQAVSAAEIGVGASPGKLSFELKPGAQGEQSIYVINTGSETAGYEINIDNAAYKGWFSVSPSSFSLQAGENKEVKVKLSLPSSASADVDCKVQIVPTSGTELMAGIRVPVHIDVLSSGTGGGSSGGSSSSSGGGGGGGGSPEPASNVESKELAQQFVGNGNRVRFTFTQEATSVGYVEFDAKKSAGKTTTIVEELKGQSTLTPTKPKGEVYQHLNIWVGNGGFANQENIGNAVVGFRVSKAWVKENNIDVGSIALQHFADEKWNSLPTTKVEEDDEYFYFKAETPGFSPFAVTGKKIGADESEVSAAEGTDSKALQDTESNAPVKRESEEDAKSESSPGFCSILAGAGIAASAVLLRRKVSR